MITLRYTPHHLEATAPEKEAHATPLNLSGLLVPQRPPTSAVGGFSTTSPVAHLATDVVDLTVGAHPPDLQAWADLATFFANFAPFFSMDFGAMAANKRR